VKTIFKFIYIIGSEYAVRHNQFWCPGLCTCLSWYRTTWKNWL